MKEATLQFKKPNIPANSEIEKAKNFFKLQNRITKKSAIAQPPLEGEEWRIFRSLPSGLAVGYKFGFPKMVGFMISNEIKKITGRDKDRYIPTSEKHDARPYQYDVEALKKSTSLVYLDHWQTDKVSWHPSEPFLVTVTGNRGNVKLWNAKNGKMLTPEPFQISYGFGNSVEWMNNGEMFKSDNNCLHYGKTGSRIFSCREINDFVENGSENFGCLQWRPNSDEFAIPIQESVLGFYDYPSKTLKKAVDFKSGKIITVSWHPSGEYLALAFEDSGIQIVEVQNYTLVSSISGQFILGWTTEGKGLIFRKEHEFMLWDGGTMKEEKLPQEATKEAWFWKLYTDSNNGLKHFLSSAIFTYKKKMSADGQRVAGKNDDGSLSVFDASSEKLLTKIILPNDQITDFDWSPIDGGLLATCGGVESQVWRLKNETGPEADIWNSYQDRNRRY